MRKLFAIISALVLLIPAQYAGAQEAKSKKPKKPTVVLGTHIPKDTTKFSSRSLKVYEIVPKGEWQIGGSVAYADLSSDDSEFMLLVDGASASASVLRLAPYLSYAYKSNQSVGVRFNYTAANCALDQATLDLLGNLELAVNDINVKARTIGASVYNRSYVGLDRRGRVGLFMDVALGYSRTKSVFAMGNPSDAYTMNRKISLSFAPGVTFFPMNNVSCFLSLSLADASYNMTRGYSGGEVTGTRDFFRIQAKLNLLAVNFGLAVHL